MPTDLVVFYTGEGIERLVAARAPRGLETRRSSRALARTPKLTRGPKPKRALRSARARRRSTRRPSPRRRASIAAARGDRGAATARRAAALQRGPGPAARRASSSSAASTVDCVAPYVYASAADDERVAELIGELAAGRVDAIAFTSKAQVQRLLELARQARARSGVALRARANEGRGHRPRRGGRADGARHPRRHDARQKAIR